MNKFIFRSHSILIILLLLSCQKDELKRTYPILSTQEVVNITAQGASFSASFSNAIPDDILDCGFVWGESGALTVENSLRISLGKPTGPGFSAEAKSSLLPNVRYQLRSFVRTKDGTVYGPAVQFMSLGSSAPLFEDFNPKKAKQGDTLTITGKYFGQNLAVTKVIFESLTNRPAIIVSPIKLSDTQIRVVVPEALVEHITQIKLQVLGNTSKAPGTFELMQPLITALGSSPVHYFDSITVNYQNNGFTLTGILVNGVSIPARITPQFIRFSQPIPSDPMTIRIKSNTLFDEKTFSNFVQPPAIASGLPASLAAGDTLHLTWTYPLPTALQAYTYIYNAPLPVLNKTNSGMSVIIPSCLRGSSKLTISAADFSFLSSTYTISPPKMLSVSPAQAGWGDLLTITGTDFYPDKSIARLTIGSVDAQIQSISKTQIKAHMPVIPPDYTPSSPGKIDIAFAPCNQGPEPPLVSVQMKAPVISSVSPLVFNAFPKQVTITGDNFIPSPYEYYNHVTIAGIGASVISATKTQIIASIGPFDVSISTQGTVQVQAFDQTATGPVATVDVQSRWTPLTYPPMPHRSEAISFGINNKGYYGMGLRNATLLNDFWEYDPVNKTWTAIPDFPGEPRFEPVYFVASGKVYVGLGYNLDYPGGGKYYNDFWEFNPATKQWAAVASLPGVGRAYCAAFSSANLGFAGGGMDKNANYINDFYQFDPANGSWTQIGNIPITDTWGFVTFNNKGYVFARNSNFITQGAIFDIATKQWSTDNNIPSVPNPGISQLMALPTNAIVNSNVLYNPETKILSQLSGPYSGTMYIEGGFVLNGIGYIFYQDPNNIATPYKFVSFDPTK